MSLVDASVPRKDNLGRFSIHETHGIEKQPGHAISASSERLGWASVFASEQREQPYESIFPAVDDHLVVLNLSGPVQVTWNLGSTSGSRVVPVGGVFSFPGGKEFRLRLAGPADTFHVYLRRSLVSEVAKSLNRNDPSHLELSPRLGVVDPMAERLLLGIRDVMVEGDSGSSGYADILARALAARLICSHSSRSSMDQSIGTGGLDRQRLERVFDYIEDNLSESIRVSSLAETACLSETHFARLFHKSMGISPHQYLIKLRVERAKRLLSVSEDSIAEIAFNCGFASQEHLTRIFRSRIGTTPARYRKEHGNRGPSVRFRADGPSATAH